MTRNQLENCTGCTKELFEGDMGTWSADGCYFCESCSPNISDVIKEWRDALQSDPDCWLNLDFESRSEMKQALARLEQRLALKGDRCLAVPL